MVVLVRNFSFGFHYFNSKHFEIIKLECRSMSVYVLEDSLFRQEYRNTFQKPQLYSWVLLVLTWSRNLSAWGLTTPTSWKLFGFSFSASSANRNRKINTVGKTIETKKKMVVYSTWNGVSTAFMHSFKIDIFYVFTAVNLFRVAVRDL